MNDENAEEMKTRRRRDFEARAADEAQPPMTLAAGGEIVTIHPLADEQELLSRLGIRPEECRSVDGYWRVGGDVVFLQVSTADVAGVRSPGLYARIATYPPRHVNLVVVVDVPYITRAVLEKAADDLLRVGWDPAEFGEKLVELTREGSRF
jgi:hypothetical protein